MNPIKKFFERRRAERKFKSAGPAHQLSEDPISKDVSKTEGQSSQHRPHHVSKEGGRAAAAALERIQQQQHQSNLNWSSQAIKIRAKKELELENTNKEKAVSKERQVVTIQEDIPNFTVSGVYFSCPIIGPEILPKAALQENIRSFLYEQLEHERGLTACLIIHTLNKNKNMVQRGVETLARYLTNIIDEPTEEKYRKIRIMNRVFQEKVADLEGAFDFLLAAGFTCQKLKCGNEEEEYLVFQDDCIDIEKLQLLKEALFSAEPIKPILDRNMKVLKPADVAKKINLPQAFFNLTLEDIKREQEVRVENVELLTTLRTKEMRNKDEIKERHMYKYSLVRVRFPDGIILQGTFSVHEKLAAVREFIAENLMDPSREFDLLLPGGNRLSDDSETLIQLKLVPAVILNFLTSNVESSDTAFLKPECMSLLSDL